MANTMGYHTHRYVILTNRIRQQWWGITSKIMLCLITPQWERCPCWLWRSKLPSCETATQEGAVGPVRARGVPGWQSARKWGPRAYSCKWTNSVKIPNELGSRLFPSQASKAERTQPTPWLKPLVKNLAKMMLDSWPVEMERSYVAVVLSR